MSDELEQWMRRVDEFGGRVSNSSPENLLGELKASNLGSTKTVVTTGPASDFPRSITLAEVKLSRPMLLDVIADMPNVLPSGPVDPGIDIGNATYKITFGIPSAPPMTVSVDAARGWRHSFMASYLRVEFVPVATDLQAFPAAPTMPGAQARDLRVAASVGPSTGAMNQPLRRTVYFGDIAALALGGGQVPPWARDFWFTAEVTGTRDFTYRFSNGFFSTIYSEVKFTPTAANGIDFALTSYKRPVPQNAQFLQIQSNAAGVVVANPQVIYELAL